ncbi:MAG: ComEC/Rec2 family competence protein, partial [Pseudomonadota bacterium]
MVADAAHGSGPEVVARSGRRPSILRAGFLFRTSISRWAALDAARITLWTPVAIGIGAGIYFGLKAEPDWRLAVVAMIVSMVLAVRLTRMRKLFSALTLFAVGFVAADWRTHTVEAPQLSRELGIVETIGRIISVEEGATQRRYVLAVEAIDGLDGGDLPARVRITWRGDEFDAKPGDRVTVRAGLSPPPPPVAPGAFDFARQLYFKQIGGVGFAVTAPEVDQTAEKSTIQVAAASIESLRLSLAQRIVDAAPGEGGAILAAIVTGKRGAISDRAEAALRDAGLAHLLAISGLHMGLATGLVFFTVRYGLAAIEPIALRFPIKKWAAAAALASGLFYLILSGGGWSARRAFIMAAIIFAAVLVDRRALSLRNVAVAAVIILLTTPEALFSPGFQMSFAAVT